MVKYSSLGQIAIFKTAIDKLAWFCFVNKNNILFMAHYYTEEQLINGVRNNCRESFNYLYDNYSAALLLVIKRIVRNEHTSEDLLQETFINIWANIAQFNVSKGHLYTWMVNIAKNKAIDYSRSKAGNMSKRINPEGETVLGEMESAGKQTEHIGILKLVENLSPKYRSLIYNVFFNGNTLEEVANWQAVPLGTIKTRMRSSISILRKDFQIAC